MLPVGGVDVATVVADPIKHLEFPQCQNVTKQISSLNIIIIIYFIIMIVIIVIASNNPFSVCFRLSFICSFPFEGSSVMFHCVACGVLSFVRSF